MIDIGRFRTWRAMGLVALAASLTAGPAMGWGRLGHRVAGRIAEDRLTPAARAAVRGLLAPGESLTDVSTWADDYRRDHPETGPWHYVNVPITEPKFDPKIHPEGGKRRHQGRRVPQGPGRPRDPSEARVRASEIPDPLRPGLAPAAPRRPSRRPGRQQHAGPVLRQGVEPPRRLGLRAAGAGRRDEPAYVEFLSGTITPELADAWSSGTAVDWANESLGLARRAYQDPATGAALKSGDRLGRPYRDANLPRWPSGGWPRPASGSRKS